MLITTLPGYVHSCSILLRVVISALLIQGPGCKSHETVARRPNILVIVVDTLRFDHLGFYGHVRDTSPALDRLAKQSVVFDHAYSSAPWTKPSIASILTGLYTTSHTVSTLNRRLPKEITTLAERLKQQGYATAGIVSHELITSEYQFDQGFDIFLEDFARGHMSVSTHAVIDQTIEVLDTLAREEAPFFLFVHLFDPHYFFLRHPEYGFAGERPDRIRWNAGMAGLRLMDPPPNEAEIRYLLDAYDEEIRFTDAGIGRLLERFVEKDLFDDAVIVFTADHGEEFYEHGWIGHTISINEELVHIPLLIHLPGGEQAGSRIQAPVSTVALAATLLDLIDQLPTPSPFQEGSLLPLIRRDPGAFPAPVYVEVDFDRIFKNPKLRHFEDQHKSALRAGRWKLIFDRTTHEHVLYDIDNDRQENTNVAAAHPDVVDSLLPLLKRKIETVRGEHPPPELRMVSSEEEKTLRDLGYVE